MSSVTQAYGANIAFIEELYEKYRTNPESVSTTWREFFADYTPVNDEQFEEELEHSRAVVGASASGPAVPQPAPTSSTPAKAPAAVPAPSPVAPAAARPVPVPSDQKTVALRGAAGKIAQNMEASLLVPTATSIRVMPVKALEENRRVINNHFSLTGQSKASYTHIIAFAIIKAVKLYPRMNSGFAMQDGTPFRIDRDDVNIGLAIDVERKDGSRSLLVPSIKRAQTMDFAQFIKSYNDIVRKARNSTLEIADFEGTTISLTNPGTIGTIASVPRLMQTQGVIVATGSIDYPAEYSAADPTVLADLGISKVMTMTSTYDHRIIQGAESGAFLAHIHELLIGQHNFYDEIYRDLRIPYEPVRWSRDRNRLNLGGANADEVVAREAAVLQMINAYRVRGHLLADLDPLEYKVGHHPELNLEYYGLTLWDLDREFVCGGLCGKMTARLRDILDTVRETYCGHIGPEYMHISETEQKKWLQDRMEPTRNKQPLELDTKRRILQKLNDAEAFERFLHTKFVGHKRFSLEGAESLVPMLDNLFNEAAGDGAIEAVMGMAHRGRLNVLATVLGKSYEQIFREFEGNIDPSTREGSGDVKYHLGADGEHLSPGGAKLKLTLASNPSHLEAVDPVAEGMVRAKQKLVNDRRRAWVIPVLLHGDAAFAGQGVVAETLNLSQLKGYRTGGTIHVVINNQIGFTTGPESARSSVYATDVAKAVQAPIFHVNGDDPEACLRAMKLAYAFRQQFQKDVVIDMICYRRHGHNEGDEPSLTQPKMYKLIKEHRSVRKIYTETLLRRGDIDPTEAEQWLEAFQLKLQEAFDRTKEQVPPPSKNDPLWTDEELTGFQKEPSPDTSITREQADKVGAALTTVPESFALHPKLKPVLAKRKTMVDGADNLDWATAEQLAFGSLLLDGFRVRLSGQDSGRGTFSHRHAILFDSITGTPYVPLNTLAQESQAVVADPIVTKNALTTDTNDPQADASFGVYDSLLSEYGVVGFEYGYSVADPGCLVMWEAQFGDFMNGAQIIIDQFIASAEEKWGQHSGLVMLLPHGYEGQGPEHSSARLERFLVLCAEGNMQVVYPSTPAQYFHALRRQMKNNPRKPLIVMTPKSLLRLPAAVSPVQQLLSGRFEPVLPDSEVSGEVSRVIITAGKVYYDLRAAREKAAVNVPIIRLEQFYPFPQPMIAAALKPFAGATEVIWVQEEPRNMGAWTFLQERLAALLGPNQKLRYVGRPVAAAPATGSHHRHEEQQHALVEAALRG